MKKTGFDKVSNSLKPLLKKGIEKKVFSAVATGIYQNTKNEEKRLILTQGKTRNDDQGVLVNRKTLFDLASLTKPLCTVLCLLCLMEKEKLGWKSRLGELLPYRLPGEYNNISLNQLMSHSAGLIAYKPFYKEFSPELRKDVTGQLIQKVFAQKLEYTPGSRCLYSDLGYMLLGEIIESVSGDKVDIFFREKIATPLGLENKIFFRYPGATLETEKKNITATEACPWRSRIVQGEVHDEHCWLMNGVAGHAGLFGTIHGVLDLTAHILNQWQGREEHPSYSNKLLQTALTRQHNDNGWCFGFDTPSPTGSSGGRYISKESVGHLGFTGTSFWIDPEKNMVVVLLTNRVHLTRDNEKIKQFRPLLHDTVFRAMQV